MRKVLFLSAALLAACAGAADTPRPAVPGGNPQGRSVPALTPRARNEADWWVKRFARNRGLIAACGGTYDVVMLGDSITHYWEIGEGLDDSRDIEILERKYRILNCGYGGDRIENLLWRVQNGELDGYRARLVTLMIGTNNCHDPAEEIIAGVRNVLGEIRRRQPQAKVLLMGYLPIGEARDDRRRKRLEEVTPAIRSLADGQSVVWFDCSGRFLRPDGTTDKALFDYEYIHPSTDGYRVWREALEPVLEKLLCTR